MADKALARGPEALSAAERRVILLDPHLVEMLHARVWALEERERAARWGRPGSVGAAGRG
jgi:membrane glycosyltransferase